MLFSVPEENYEEFHRQLEKLTSSDKMKRLGLVAEKNKLYDR